MKPNRHVPLAAIISFFMVVLLLPVTIGTKQGEGGFCLSGLVALAEDAGEDVDPFASKTEKDSKDHMEQFNRSMYDLNDKFYFWFLKPVAQGYSVFLPPGIRIGIRNAFRNFDFPIRFVNNTLQGKFKGAGIETARFLINSTLGMGGFFEVASKEFDLNPYEEDTGQTLGFYGLPPGPHIHLPLLGPSNVRDVVGLIGDGFLNPVYYLSPDYVVSIGIKAGRIVNSTSVRIGEYEDFKKGALDPYVAARDAYEQHRTEEIKK